MKGLLIWTIILVIADVLYLLYERNKLNPSNASNFEALDKIIKTRKKNRFFFVGLNIFALGLWLKSIKEDVSLLLMLIGTIMAFVCRPC